MNTENNNENHNSSDNNRIDILLVKKAKKGDDEAFEKLYSIIYRDLYKYAYYMLGNSEDAKDTVSECIIEVYQNIKKLREDKLFRNWVFKILSNKCRMKRKSYINSCIPIDDESLLNMHGAEMDVEGKTDMESAFNILSEEEKEVVSLSVFGGYKSNEIAEMFEIKATTVRSKLSRALAKMQRKMEVRL